MQSVKQVKVDQKNASESNQLRKPYALWCGGTGETPLPLSFYSVLSPQSSVLTVVWGDGGGASPSQLLLSPQSSVLNVVWGDGGDASPSQLLLSPQSSV